MAQCSRPVPCFYCNSEASYRFESCKDGTCEDCLKMLLRVFMPASEVDEWIRRHITDAESPITEARQ